MNRTDEQARAIDLRGENILLSAAAGSGKTTVLVARVLALIETENADLDRMLIVTFTRAASADMRAKLSETLSRRAAEGDARCREQLLMLDRASITTLHGFCAEFLRAHFEAAQVDPAFRVLDDAESRRIADDSLDDAIEEAYAQGGEALLALDYGRGPKGVRALAEGLFYALDERPDPEAWLDRACAMDADMRAAWTDELVRDARTRIDRAILMLRQALMHPECTENYAGPMETDVSRLLEMRSIEGFDDLRRALNDFKLTRALGKKGAGAFGEVPKKLRDQAKTTIEGVALRDFPLAQAFADAEAQRPQLRRLGEITRRAMALMAERKAEISALSYSDLEHFALRALTDGDTARALREQYDYVFIDEYQDTSDVQEALIGRIARENNLFMVGDVKQSIYRFRHAEPALFLDKYARYGRGEGGRLLCLTMNFRSDPAILNFVNRVFERAMHGGASEIVYDAAARLNAGRESMGGSVTVHILTAPDAEDEAADRLRCEREALFIASRIKARMRAEPALRYRDFAILTRAKRGVLGPMARVLTDMGIPAYADGTEGFFDSVEIDLALSMLKLTANARSDVELIGVLRSAVAGLTDSELARIRIAQRNTPFVDACRAYAEGGDETAEKLKRFFGMLARWRLMCGNLDLGVLVRTILDESGLYDFAGAMVGGEQRQANLNRLVQNAAAFDRTVSGSLTRFLRQTEKLRERGDGDDAHILGENDDVVRLMTAHKSKGLEFPVVFGAMMGRRFGGGGSSAPLTAERDLGIGCVYCDEALQTRRKTPAQIAIAAREDRKSRAEELRVLYVLLTRAKCHLELVGSVTGVESAKARWAALAGVPDAAGSWLDVIMPAALEGACAVEYPENPYRIEERAADDSPVRALLTARDADEADVSAMLWKYDGVLNRQPLKLTVTGLLRDLQGPEVIDPLIERPAFMAEDRPARMTGAERGTAYHRAMELLELAALRGASARESVVRARLDEMTERARMTSGFSATRFRRGRLRGSLPPISARGCCARRRCAENGRSTC